MPTISRPQPIQDKDLRHMYPMDFSRSDSIGTMNSLSSAISSATEASYKRDGKNEDRLPIGGSWIELFYDLFFAASLSAFSDTREVSGRRDLLDLAAFFSILWWTWASQTLFDVRYARHNRVETAMKFLQLLIMIGYGVFESKLSLFMSPERTLNEQGDRELSLRHRSGPRMSAVAIISIFVLSRFLLAAQYLAVALRRQRSAGHLVKSSLISAALPLLAAVLWIASLFVLEKSVGKVRMFAARSALWMAGILVEMVGTFVLRLHKSSGFEKTHLTERFGSLTIILLGEGVIRLLTVLRDISTGVGFEVRSGVAIAASIFSFYLIWALYFDGSEIHDRVSSTRAYHWAYMHFFFHLALVILLEDITSLLLFSNLYGGMNALLDPAREASVLADLFHLHGMDESIVLSNLTITNHSDGTMTHIDGSALSRSEFDYLFINLFGKIFKAYNIEPAKSFLDLVARLDPRQIQSTDVDRAFKLLLQQFVTSAQFFLIAAGVMFLTMIPITVWRNTTRSRIVWMTRLLVGLGLLIGAASVDSRGERLGRVLVSGALIPAFMCLAGLVYALDRVPFSRFF